MSIAAAGQVALVLETAERLIVPDSVRAELANVMWQWVTKGDVPLSVATVLTLPRRTYRRIVLTVDRRGETAASMPLTSGIIYTTPALPMIGSLFCAIAQKRKPANSNNK